MADENYEPQLITLEDEDGKSSTFEVLDTLEEGDDVYYALVPCPDEPQESLQESTELIVLKLEDPDDPESSLITVDDDEEYERIGNIFLKRLEDFYDGEDFDGDDYDDEDGEE